MIIGFVNEKGGVAKTTLAIHAATWLAKHGHRVVLIDLDTQAGVSHFFGLKPADDVAELLRSALFLRADRRPPITSFLVPCPGYSNLVIIRGHNESGEVEADLRQPGRPRAGAVLAEALGELTTKGAIIVCDSGPYAGKLQEAILEAADHVFIPAIPEGASEVGILKVGQHLQSLGRTVTGLIPTLYTTTSKKHEETILDWQKIDGLGALVYYDPPRLVGLPKRILWGELYRQGKAVWDVTPAAVKATRADLETAQGEMTAILQRVTLDVMLRRKSNNER